MGNTPVHALVDTGADLTAANDRIVEDHPEAFEILPGYPQRRILAAGQQQPLSVKGVAKTTLTIGTRTYPIYVWIVADLKQDLVIGTDTLYSVRGTVDVYRGYLFHGPRGEPAPVNIKIRGARPDDNSPYLVVATSPASVAGNHKPRVSVKAGSSHSRIQDTPHGQAH